MERDRIEMSCRERDVLKMLAPVLEGRRAQAKVARLLKRSVRQVRRIQRRLEAEGDAGVISSCAASPQIAGSTAPFAGRFWTPIGGITPTWPHPGGEEAGRAPGGIRWRSPGSRSRRWRSVPVRSPHRYGRPTGTVVRRTIDAARGAAAR